MCLTNSRIHYAPVNFDNAIWLPFGTFSKKSGRLSSTGSEILTFGSHCSANFQPILDCFIPKFKLEYDNLGNIKTDGINTVNFNLHQIKCLKVLLGGHPVYHLFSLITAGESINHRLPRRRRPHLVIALVICLFLVTNSKMKL